MCALGWLLDILLCALLKNVKYVEVLFFKINTTAALQAFTESLLVFLNVLGTSVYIIKYDSHETFLA
jgi:hypothetical protein